MKISLIHPSRNRPAQAAKTANKWLSSAKNRKNIEYILSIDRDEPMSNIMAYETLDTDQLLCFSNQSAIEAINRGAKYSMGDLLIVISDDFSCPFHWDDALLTMLKDQSDFIVKTDDGAQPWIITLPIMDRIYYNRTGYIYDPGYKHMFADTAMTHVADLLDRKITLPIKFPHDHYTTGKNAKDEVNVKNDGTWAHGEELYLHQVRHNFGLPGGTLKCDQSHVNFLRSKGIDIVVT